MRKYNRFLLLVVLMAAAAGFAETREAEDRVQFGHSIRVGPEEVAGDVVCIGCSIGVAGHVKGDLVAVGGGATVDGAVDGDAVVVGGRLRLGPEARVRGDVSVTGGDLQRDPNAVVGGSVTATRWPVFIGSGMGAFFLLALLAMIPLGLVLGVVGYLAAGERRIAIIAGTMQARLGLALLSGLGVLVAAAVVAALFSWTGPFSAFMEVMIFLALLATAVVGYCGASFWVGRGLARSVSVPWAVLIGAAVIAVAQSIPLIGVFAFLFFFLTALGAAALSGFGTAGNWLVEQFSSQRQVPPASASAAD